MKLILCNPRPPIPDCGCPIPHRGCDWCLHEDGEEESSERGWGETPLDAGIDFLTGDRFDNSKSPLIQALQRALAVMDEPGGPVVASDVPSDLQARLFRYDEQMHRIEDNIKEALRMLGVRS